MASGEVPQQKYEKVDSFLKRSLPSERYNAVRLIEPCVAVSNEYNKEFKFAVLASDWLYVAANPPKNAAKDVEEVTKIVDITSVELLNDVPNFLGGDLKYRAHHILITYKKDGSRDLYAENVEETQGAVSDVDDSFKEYYMTLGDDTLEEEFLEKEKDSNNNTQNTVRGSSLAPFNIKNETGQPLHHSLSALDYMKQKDVNKKSMRLISSANTADLRRARAENGLTVKSFSAETTINSEEKEKGFGGSFSGLRRRWEDRKRSKAADNEETTFVQLSDSLKDGKKVEPVGGRGERLNRLDLYMLLDKTVMLAYLQSTWNNCLLNAVLKQSNDGNMVSSNMMAKKSVIELFDQLENEITCSEEVETTFVLVNELYTASQKNNTVKKLFWQSPDLFVFMVRQLKRCSNSLTSYDASRVNKADELDSMLLFLKCLSGMFRETELYGARMANLKRDKYLVLSDLLCATISAPETKISKVVQAPEISEAAEVLLTGRRRKKKPPKQKTPYDMELEYLASELTKYQVILLHELFIIANEAAWFSTDDNKLNIRWMVKNIESLESIYRFLKCFMQQIMNVVRISELEEISSEDTTFLYRLFSVMKTLLKESIKLRAHVQEYYTEEFRYYVKIHVLNQRLPKNCPLTTSTLKLIDDVIGAVTSGGRWCNV